MLWVDRLWCNKSRYFLAGAYRMFANEYVLTMMDRKTYHYGRRRNLGGRRWWWLTQQLFNVLQHVCNVALSEIGSFGNIYHRHSTYRYISKAHHELVYKLTIGNIETILKVEPIQFVRNKADLQSTGHTAKINRKWIPHKI